MRLRIIIIFSFFIIQSVFATGPLVITKLGSIQGVNADDSDYAMFLGIPYAKVDESNPFGLSSPYGNFEDVFLATNESMKCPQMMLADSKPSGSLNCLTINIFKPNSGTSTNKLPVMVFIYGGSHQRGEAIRSMYGPKFLLKHDVILVTLNYRVGIYGFMCLDIPEVPGNQGIKDQIAALKWIKENIDSFGGDSNSITAFGQSAGARSLDLLLTFSQEELFHKCILQSASALTPLMFKKPNVTNVIEVTKRLGHSTNDIRDALKYLAAVDPITVVQEAAYIDYDYYPCIEMQMENTDNFMTDYAFNVYMPKVNDIPIMIGICDDEQLANFYDKDAEYYKTLNIFYDNLKNTFNFDNHTLNESEVLVRRFYIGDEPISINQFRGITDFQSDFRYVHPVIRSVQKYLDNGYKEVYHYVFSYVGGRNYVRRNGNIMDTGGAAHSDDIGYLFDIQKAFDEEICEEDQVIINRMTSLWTNFAKYGQPTPETSEVLPVKWESVTNELFNYYVIDSELSLRRRPFQSRMAFWDLFYSINEKYLIGYKNNASTVRPIPKSST